MPYQHFEWLVTKLKDEYGMEYTSVNGENLVLNSCTVMFGLPSVFLMLGDYWYEVRPEDYILVIDGLCRVCIE